MSKAYINIEMLAWALNRSGIDMGELASRLGASEAKVQSWFDGEDLPTFKQAQRVSAVLQIPFGFLYLPTPPTERIPIAEFRRLPGVANSLSRNVFDLLADIDFKRDWYREYREREGFEPLAFVGRFGVDASASLVAADIRRELSRESNSLFRTRKTHERFLEALMQAAERLGIWVMRSGIVGSNTHRTIEIQSLRGFAIADKVVPLIFLNGKDSKSAQIFTFAHELAHIWIGKSSIDQGELSELETSGDERTEQACNAIAAEFLVPSDDFMAAWNKDIPLTDQVDRLAERFSVSRIVVARRALEQGQLDPSAYREFYTLEARRWSSLAATRSTGGSYYAVVPVRNGKAFTKTVTKEVASGRLMYRDAAQLLGIQPSKVRELHERSGA